jgi:hypothetical protein
MSSAVVSTSAALGRSFLFDDEAEAEVRSLSPARKACPEPVEDGYPDERSSIFWQRKIQSTIKNQQSTISLTPASQLGIRPAPEMASSGISDLDALTGGLPRGCLTEICGPASSGRTTVLLAALAAATRRGEYCALIDASDALDPHSIAAAGVDLDRLLWVRCGEDSPRRRPSAPLRAGYGAEKNYSEELRPHKKQTQFGVRPSEHRLEQVLRATDLLLESGGFGLIILDLADLPTESARRIPLTTWFRFRRAVEHKPTILLAIEQQPIAGSCSSLQLQLRPAKDQSAHGDEPAAKRRKNAAHGASRGSNAEEDQAPKGRKKIWAGNTPDSAPSHAHMLTGLAINVELTRSRIERKPSQSIIFETKTAWAG